MRQKLIIGNWKMNKDLDETKSFLQELNATSFHATNNLHYGLAMPYINIPAAMAVKKNDLIIASQDLSVHEQGAYTGEISAKMLVSHGVKYAIIGHSERRQYHNESDGLVNQKAKIALAHNITPIICVGETLDQYNQKLSKEIIEQQIKASLKDLDLAKIVVAYEPVWAIGTGKTATLEYAQEMCHFIRGLTSDKLIIQYGGSVNEENVKALLSQPDIDGALVGGASLKVSSFINLIK